MNRFLNHLGDRINPIVVKEMRQAVNSRFVSFMLVLFLAVELVVMVVMLEETPSADPDVQNMRVGREVFKVLQVILMGCCMLLIPAMAGGRLMSERSDVNVDLLFITSLSPRAIMAGKFIAATALAMLLFSACAPFMTFAYLLRGLDISTILLILVSDFVVVLVGIMFALLVASISASRGLRVLLGLFGVIFVGYLTAGFQAMTFAFLEFELRVGPDGANFWLAYLGLLGVVIGGLGLMFVWATALISPPTSNRIFPVRLYTLAFWALCAAGCMVWAVKIDRPEPMLIWGIFGAGLFSLQFLISSSERDTLGPRVLRRIPRSPLWRIPAFLFYSGAAGGFVFCLCGWAATLVLMMLSRFWIPGSGDFIYLEMPKLAAVIAGYSYCFCLTAVIFRRLLHATSFKSSATWLLVLILFGLGTILPYLAHSAIYPKRYGYYTRDVLWLYLPSPIVMVDAGLHNQFELIVVFLALWGVAVTLINIGWLAGQMVKFRPPAAVEVPDETDAS